MLVTQRKARKILRDRTRKSHAWCEEQVRLLATEKDQERMKLHDFKLEALINVTNNPPAVPRPNGIRSISRRKAQKIRSYA